MKTMDYQRHFAVLLAAALVIGFSGNLPTPTWISRSAFFFGLMGALHALAVVAASTQRAELLRSIVFVGVTSALSVAAPILGSILASAAGDVGEFGFFLAVILASAIGASTYWFLIRWSWIRDLSYKSLGFTVAVCALTTPAAFLAAAALTDFGRGQGAPRLIADALPTVAWWCAFSISLYCGDASHCANKRLPNACKATRV
jgi:hypothetical protein